MENHFSEEAEVLEEGEGEEEEGGEEEDGDVVRGGLWTRKWVSEISEEKADHHSNFRREHQDELSIPFLIYNLPI